MNFANYLRKFVNYIYWHIFNYQKIIDINGNYWWFKAIINIVIESMREIINIKMTYCWPLVSGCDGSGRYCLVWSDRYRGCVVCWGCCCCVGWVRWVWWLWWLFQHAKVSLVLFLLRPMTLLSSACDKGLGREKICILCEKKCFSLATTLKLKFCGISTFKAMELSTL